MMARHNLIQHVACALVFITDPLVALLCSWAAYVAGALLVLMHEVGQTFNDGLSLLISSDVPDGKGVSSSAALEVAAMCAIAAAYGIRLEATQVAALCQKVGGTAFSPRPLGFTAPCQKGLHVSLRSWI